MAAGTCLAPLSFYPNYLSMLRSYHGYIVLECEVKPIMGKLRNFERSNTTYFFIYYGGLIPLSYILYILYITLYSAEQTYINKKICRCIDGTRLEIRSITPDDRWDNSRRVYLFINQLKMVALIIKNVILFWLLVWFTAVWIQAYWEKQEWWTGFCALILFFISIAQLFNLIDLVF